MESWDVGFTVVAETFDRVSRPCRQASFIAISSSTSNFPNSSLLLYDRELKTWTFYSFRKKKKENRKERAKKLRKDGRHSKSPYTCDIWARTWPSANYVRGIRLKPSSRDSQLPSLTFSQSGAKRLPPATTKLHRSNPLPPLLSFLFSLSPRNRAKSSRAESKRDALSPRNETKTFDDVLEDRPRKFIFIPVFLRATKNVTSVVNNHDGGRNGHGVSPRRESFESPPMTRSSRQRERDERKIDR